MFGRGDSCVELRAVYYSRAGASHSYGVRDGNYLGYYKHNTPTELRREKCRIKPDNVEQNLELVVIAAELLCETVALRSLRRKGLQDHNRKTRRAAESQ